MHLSSYKMPTYMPFRSRIQLSVNSTVSHLSQHFSRSPTCMGQNTVPPLAHQQSEHGPLGPPLDLIPFPRLASWLASDFFPLPGQLSSL